MGDPLSTTLRALRCDATDRDPAIIDPPTDADGAKAFIAQWAGYVRSRDEADLTGLLREGVAPTWFIVRRLPAAWLCSVLDGVFPLAARRALAFRAAVQRVEVPDAPMVAADLGPEQYGVALAPEAWMQTVVDRFGGDVIQEMGQVAIDLSRLPKGRRGPFSPWGGTVLSS